MTVTICCGDSNHAITIGWLVGGRIQVAAVVACGHNYDAPNGIDGIDGILVGGTAHARAAQTHIQYFCGMGVSWYAADA